MKSFLIDDEEREFKKSMRTYHLLQLVTGLGFCGALWMAAVLRNFGAVIAAVVFLMITLGSLAYHPYHAKNKLDYLFNNDLISQPYYNKQIGQLSTDEY